MSKLFKLVSIFVAGVFLFSSTAYVYAVPDVTVPITITPVVVGASFSMSVNIKNHDGSAATAISFGTLGTLPWRIADQYLEVIPSANYPLWGVRIVSDNNAAGSPYAGMAPKPIAPGPDLIYGGGVAGDDTLSYGGLIDVATISNPDNRADLAWQIQEDPVAVGTLTLADNSLYGRDAAGVRISTLDNWNADWAAVVDRSNSRVVSAGAPRTLAPIGIDPDSDYTTVTYSSILQGGPGSYGMNHHPITPTGGDYTVPAPRPGDVDGVIVYLGARLDSLSSGSYGVNGFVVELIHE